MEANQATNNPVVALANARELFKRAAAVKTEGLPADLAAAFQEMNRVMQQADASMKDLPVAIEDSPSYLTKEKAKGAEAEAEVQARIAAFQTTLDTLQTEGAAAAAKLKEAGAKYGIESFELGDR